MKKFFYLSVLVLMFGCGNSEQVYNETIARIYYEVSDMLEASYKKIEKGEYQTTFEKGSEFHKPQTLIDAQNLKSLVATEVEIYDLLKPSDAANDFHAKVGDFFRMVNEEYVTSLEFLGNIDCDCPEKKDSVIASIKTIYGKISKNEDKMLETQKQYFEKIGATGIER